MTERKPPGVSFETWIDRQIRQAQERGDFDELPGAGKPLPEGDVDDDLWWVKGYLRREGLSGAVMLPTSLRLRREIELLPGVVRELSSERVVRERVAELNHQIEEYRRAPTEPYVPVRPVDADGVVARWRADRDARAKAAGTTAGTTDDTATATDGTPTAASRRNGWWRRPWRRGRR
jgi:hypothetical protein